MSYDLPSIRLHLIPVRFVSPDIAKKYDLTIPKYAGIDQIVEVENGEQKL